MGDALAGKEGRADIAHETTDRVDGEDVEGVIDSDEELELRGVVGEGCSQYSVRNGSPDGNVTYSQLVYVRVSLYD
jgi:hypothetical protein